MRRSSAGYGALIRVLLAVHVIWILLRDWCLTRYPKGNSNSTAMSLKGEMASRAHSEESVVVLIYNAISSPDFFLGDFHGTRASVTRTASI